MTQPRWLAKVHCDVCNIEVSLSHYKRHTESRMHQRILQVSWPWLPSDEAFSQFLHDLRPNHFHGHEDTLYRRFRKITKAERSKA